jgi:diguanylate cyclase (GGDEF)-like protein
VNGASRTRTGDLLGAIQALSQLSYSPALYGTYVGAHAVFQARRGQGYAVPAVSFGRRLALFFFLIALLPTAALIGILVFISQDSQRGKADAHLAASLRTGVAVYAKRRSLAEEEARRLAQDPRLTQAIDSGSRTQLRAFARQAAMGPLVVRDEIIDPAGALVAAAGPADAVAFARVGLTRGGEPAGTLRVSTTTADRYVAAVRELTDADLVVTRGGDPLASTVPPPEHQPEADETKDVSTGGQDYRGHVLALNPDDQEDVLVLGPQKEGGPLGISRPATAIMIWFLVVAVFLAWALARTLTRLHDRVASQAVTDPLTGLWNRRWMGETLDREVSRAQRFGHEISMIILDVDDFKKINDRYGHLQGDIVLERVADRVRDATRSIDVAARYGGDELALILLETSRDGAKIVAERLRESAREMEIPLPEGEKGSMSVTLSLGIATIPDSAGDLAALVDAADRALLRAKRAGKDQIRVAPARRGATR